jgi:histidinol-phosphatase
VTDPDLDLALRLADAADAITLGRFRAADLMVTDKPDLTPVSDADRSVESRIRELLAELHPGDAVVGEEYGETGDAPRRWIIDPIDGTKNFVRGHPVWATLLALQVDGEGDVGVVSAPALGRRWWARRGEGTWTRDVGGDTRACSVSRVGALDHAFFVYSGLNGWGAREPNFRRLTESVWRTRGFGDFWTYTMVAEGIADIAAEPEVSLWDLAAVQVIVEEAGGTFSDVSGAKGPDGGSAIATNGLLHSAALGVLNEPAR